MICEKCKVKHDGSYGSGRFCSDKCSHSRGTRSDIIKEKIRKTYCKNKNIKISDIKKGAIILCPNCLIYFKRKTSKQKTCSKKCALNIATIEASKKIEII